MIKRTLLMSVGTIIFIAGILVFPVPIPLGIPLMIIGLSIMLKSSNKVKRLTIRLVHKNRHSRRLWRKTRDLHKRIRSQSCTIYLNRRCANNPKILSWALS